MKRTRLLLCALLCAAVLSACAPAPADPPTLSTSAPMRRPTPSPTPEPADDALVPVQDFIPGLRVELKYATTDNFTGQVIYTFTQARLRYGTVKKLAAVQQILVQQGYALLLWDAYRPPEAQQRLWDACPNPTYVANPATGGSGHSRGNTVDVTLVRADGTAVEMPSGFDDFSALADRDYRDVSTDAAENAHLLEQAMEAAGFRGYGGEWWHYSDTTDYPPAV